MSSGDLSSGSERGIVHKESTQPPFPLNQDELNQYNDYTQRITAWYEQVHAAGRSPTLPSSLDPLVVRQLVEMHVPTGAPPLGRENVQDLQVAASEKVSGVISSGKGIFGRLALGVNALAKSHGSSIEGVEGYTDEPDPTRHSERWVFPLGKSAELERNRYRVLSWRLPPVNILGKSIPHTQYVRYTRESEGQEVGVETYESSLIDQAIPLDEQTRKQKKGKEPSESGPLFVAHFDQKTGDIQGLTISWGQLYEHKSDDKIFLEYVRNISPEVAQLIDQTILHPDWPAVHNVYYVLHIDLGEVLGQSVRLPSISFKNTYTLSRYYGDGGYDTDKPATEEEVYIYSSDPNVNIFSPDQNTKNQRTFTSEEYLTILRGIKELFPTDVLKI